MISKKLLEYFNGDEMRASVWRSKYALENEEIPLDMFRRLAEEFAKIEDRYNEEESKIFEIGSKDKRAYQLSLYGTERDYLTEDSIFELFRDFRYVIPQGSIMSMLGNPNIGSLSNCFYLGLPEDSYGGIFLIDEEMAQLMKRRGGVGTSIESLRPMEANVNNSAKTSTGMVSFMERFSNTCREVAQNGRK